jgi:hypothetical protein
VGSPQGSLERPREQTGPNNLVEQSGRIRPFGDWLYHFFVTTLPVSAERNTLDRMVTQLVGVVGMFVPVLVIVLGRRRLAHLRGRAVRAVEVVSQLRPSTPPVLGRPIEEIARDANRLGHSFRCVPRGLSFARFEGCRRAYDLVLSEACRALDVDHLLGVLPPGPELDAERDRVETKLWLAGLRLDDAA